MAIQHTIPTPMKAIIIHFLQVLVLLPTLSLALPLEYTASYDIEKFGMVVARSNYTLKHENNDVRVTQHTETVGLAALIRNDVIDENSLLSIKNEQLLLTEFNYTHRSKDKKNRNIQLKIDWVNSDEKLLGTVNGTAHGKSLKLKVDNPVWDTSSYQIPLMLNTKEKVAPQKYSMMIKGRFKDYTFITHGIETIEVNGNTIDAIKIERDSGTAKSPIYLWLAPSLNNLPVKIEKWKNGDLQVTLSLNHAQFPSNKNMVFKAIDEELDEL